MDSKYIVQKYTIWNTPLFFLYLLAKAFLICYGYHDRKQLAFLDDHVEPVGLGIYSDLDRRQFGY